MNCGQFGHKFRNCPKPILSFGIACFIQNKQLRNPKPQHRDDDWLCICIQRRHTYSYVDYMRGKYPLNDKEYQRSLLKRMTCQEQLNIITQSFDTMWGNLWLEQQFPKNNIQPRRFKDNAKEKHLIMKSRWFKHNEPDKSIISKWNNAEWGYPKGRRNKTETDIEVALREFNEETGISLTNIQLISTDPNDMICENYTANNGHHYNNLYAIAKWYGTLPLDMDAIRRRNLNSYSFCAEIAKIEAFSLTEILEQLRFYEKWKQTLFRKCFSVIHIKEQHNETTDSIGT